MKDGDRVKTECELIDRNMLPDTDYKIHVTVEGDSTQIKMLLNILDKEYSVT